ncbi:MAG: UDP-N-acetylmuramoyl-tripeptide--D-alanyl-D-alanine ligase [Actinomycetota bacterium]|jgi:UDP-N-acetylmuramoyl-tripeptide--D-alanyl-D-alanine ligase
MRITASDVALAVNGILFGDDVEANGIAFDSRELVAGQAFVAIVGERDGHQFLGDAQSKGAAFALVQRGRSISEMSCVEVDDTVAALGTLGAMCRDRLDSTLSHRVVGITGSAGKTSTKNLIRAVLENGYRHVHAASQSLNNDIGVPTTIVNAPSDCDALILEMGMRGFGEIERLCEIGRPVIGVLTNVGDAHAERVGGIDGVARAKGELIESLPEHGIAILNADDERVRAMSARTWATVMTYGSAVGADVRWSPVETLNDGRVTTLFEYDGDSAVGTPSLPGEHMSANAAAAVAVGVATGMTLSQCVEAIGTELHETGRLIWREGLSGSKILDDSYNANSTSMIAALHVLARAEARRRFAILGEMKEIDQPSDSHRHIVDVARQLDIEVLAVDTDLYGIEAVTVDEVVGRLQLGDGDVVLVKGSRAAGMERVVAQLVIS